MRNLINFAGSSEMRLIRGQRLDWELLSDASGKLAEVAVDVRKYINDPGEREYQSIKIKLANALFDIAAFLDESDIDLTPEIEAKVNNDLNIEGRYRRKMFITPLCPIDETIDFIRDKMKDEINDNELGDDLLSYIDIVNILNFVEDRNLLNR